MSVSRMHAPLPTPPLPSSPGETAVSQARLLRSGQSYGGRGESRCQSVALPTRARESGLRGWAVSGGFVGADFPALARLAFRHSLGSSCISGFFFFFLFLDSGGNIISFVYLKGMKPVAMTLFLRGEEVRPRRPSPSV